MMTDRRRRNQDWVITSGSENPTWDGAKLAVLMDLRDELQALNRTLGCFRLARMSNDINRIHKLLAMRLPLRPRRMVKP